MVLDYLHGIKEDDTGPGAMKKYCLELRFSALYCEQKNKKPIQINNLDGLCCGSVH